MKRVVCDKCGYHFEVEDGAEFGYCPCCENDQVEIISGDFSDTMDIIANCYIPIRKKIKEHTYNKVAIYDFESGKDI